jgi:hypothetical protein
MDLSAWIAVPGKWHLCNLTRQLSNGSALILRFGQPAHHPQDTTDSILARLLSRAIEYFIRGAKKLALEAQNPRE